MRDPDEIAFEIEFWKQVVADITRVNDILGEMNEPILTVAVEVATLTSMTRQAQQDACERLIELVGHLQACLKKAIQRNGSVLEMASGRRKVIHEEIEEL